MTKKPVNIHKYEARKATINYERMRLENKIDSLQTRMKFLKNYIVDLKYAHNNITEKKATIEYIKKQKYAMKLARQELTERRKEIKEARESLKRLR